MCLNHNLQLYLRCLHLFKLLFALYMLVYGIVLSADVSVRQAFGSDMLGIGLIVSFLGVFKPCNIAMGHYGSAQRQNKCALLLVIVFDGVAGVVQFAIGLILVTRGTPLVELGVRKACAHAVLEAGTNEGRCDSYWREDRTAGMRLAWMSAYYRAVREKDNAVAKTLEQIEDFAQCCGFGPPVACDRVQNSAKFPALYEQTESLGNDMTKRRFTCSSLFDCGTSSAAADDDDGATLCWYPAEEGTCEHFADGDIGGANALGCRYDWGVGGCLDDDVADDAKGCAWYFEETMNDKIRGHGIAFLVCILLEVFTIFSACCLCWKRKSTDVLPVNYIYDEPWDPVKEGKLQLHVPKDAVLPNQDDDSAAFCCDDDHDSRSRESRGGGEDYRSRSSAGSSSGGGGSAG